MKNALQQIYFIFIVLSLSFILGVCNFVDGTIFHYHINDQRACSDITNHVENSQTYSISDDFIANDSKIKSDKQFGCIRIIPLVNFQLKSNYTTIIWQPPKFV